MMDPEYTIIREPDDKLAKTRISLGDMKEKHAFYIVFRGEPENVIHLLKEALATAERDLPEGNYQDNRGRPQG